MWAPRDEPDWGDVRWRVSEALRCCGRPPLLDSEADDAGDCGGRVDAWWRAVVSADASAPDAADSRTDTVTDTGRAARRVAAAATVSRAREALDWVRPSAVAPHLRADLPWGRFSAFVVQRRDRVDLALDDDGAPFDPGMRYEVEVAVDTGAGASGPSPSHVVLLATHVEAVAVSGELFHGDRDGARPAYWCVLAHRRAACDVDPGVGGRPWRVVRITEHRPPPQPPAPLQP